MSKRRLFCSQLGTKYYGRIWYHNIYFMSLVNTTSRILVPNWEQAGVYSLRNIPLISRILNYSLTQFTTTRAVYSMLANANPKATIISLGMFVSIVCDLVYKNKRRKPFNFFVIGFFIWLHIFCKFRR